jgi:hypothetical protein
MDELLLIHAFSYYALSRDGCISRLPPILLCRNILLPTTCSDSDFCRFQVRFSLSDVFKQLSRFRNVTVVCLTANIVSDANDPDHIRMVLLTLRFPVSGESPFFSWGRSDCLRSCVPLITYKVSLAFSTPCTRLIMYRRRISFRLAPSSIWVGCYPVISRFGDLWAPSYRPLVHRSYLSLPRLVVEINILFTMLTRPSHSIHHSQSLKVAI